MATQREIRKRIQSVSSTKKITNTMEMISTSKMKKMQGRLVISKPYELKLEQVIYNLITSGIDVENEILLKEKEETTKVLILMVVGNRGLCGGYNANVIENTIIFKDKLSEEGKEVLLHVIGKKGSNFFNFIDQPLHKSEINPEDKISFDDAGILGSDLIKLIEDSEVDEVYISYTKAITITSFNPVISRILPISIDEINDDEAESDSVVLPVDYIYEPDPGKIFSLILPLYVKIKLYICMLESGFAEQFARRAAMKNATEAASDMVKELTVKYNRARQAKITNEIAEIVGGAAALE